MKKAYKILIVEDEPSIIDGYAIALDASGFTALKAMDGEEGLSTALKEMPDMILSDILMPKMDGLEMLQKLRQSNEYGKKVPVILLTNLSADREDIVKKIAETGPAYYIVKCDYSFKQVVEKVKEILKVK